MFQLLIVMIALSDTQDNVIVTRFVQFRLSDIFTVIIMVITFFYLLRS